MDDFTSVLRSVEAGEAPPQDLLDLVYRELRGLAGRKMAGESAGHTLQPTALVHEAWLRLGGEEKLDRWENRAHFFGAAAEAMRRILVEHARRKKTAKRGGGAPHEELDEGAIVLTAPADELLAVHEALDRLAEEDPKAAQLVKLRYFMGMTMDETASAMDMKKRSAESLWTYARVWLHRELEREL